MARRRGFILEVLIRDGGDNTIKVGHEFFGTSEEEVRTYYREHVESCEYFKSAVQQGRAIESLEEVSEDELPDVIDFEEERT